MRLKRKRGLPDPTPRRALAEGQKGGHAAATEREKERKTATGISQLARVVAFPRVCVHRLPAHELQTFRARARAECKTRAASKREKKKKNVPAAIIDRHYVVSFFFYTKIQSGARGSGGGVTIDIVRRSAEKGERARAGIDARSAKRQVTRERKVCGRSRKAEGGYRLYRYSRI